jgi:glucokinase
MENNSSQQLILALDFGGTKLAAAVIDLTSEAIVSPVMNRPTPVVDGASRVLAAMITCGQEAIQSLAAAQKVSAVGISFGGPVSADRQSVLLSNHVSNWNGIPLVEEISRAFHLPTFMDNDGNAAALGAWWFGGYRQAENLIYIQVSTGVGAGFIFGKKLYRGSGLAAELGHYLLSADGPACSCGRNGCLESICSGWAIARDGRQALTEGCSALMEMSHNAPANIDAAMVFAACREGDATCTAIIEKALAGLASVTVNTITCLDPEVIVLGGGLTRSQDMFKKYFLPQVEANIHPFFKGRCRIEISPFEGREPLLGAALLARE